MFDAAVAASMSPFTNAVAERQNSAFAAVGMAVAGVHALMLLKDRDNDFHRKALLIALAVGISLGAAICAMRLSGRRRLDRIAEQAMDEVSAQLADLWQKMAHHA